jgi:ABC-type sulfate/molybdate transport systems ATPase subunit
MLERVQLGGLARRRVGELSGGQEQRVALARALVLEPAVLLLDEPFSSLDAALRAEMRRLVRQLHDESAVTTLFVTHDQAEAVEVADTVALLLDGRLTGSGSPDLFYRQPPSLAAARFFGVTNEIPGWLADGEFRADDVRIRPVHVRPVHRTTTAGSGTSDGADGFAEGRAVLVIRPEAVQLTPTDQEEGTVTGRVVGARFAGTHLAVEVAVGSEPAGSLVLMAHRPIVEPVTVGAVVGLRLPPEACSVFADPGGRP